MRRHVLCLLVFALAVAAAVAVTAPSASADTIKTGGNVINETWTAAGSPYILQGDITVPVGSTLTIQAGAVIRAVNSDSQAAGLDAGRVELVVKGTLDIQGTAAQPVAFSGQAAGAGSWYGLVIDAAATAATIANTSIDGAVMGITYASPGNVLTTSAVSITNARTRGVNILAGNPTLSGISIATSGTNGSDAGIVVSGNASATVNNCVIRSQAGYGVYYIPSGNTHSLALINCTIDRSTAYGVYTAGGGGTVTITSSIITNSGSFGVVRGDASTINVTYSDLWNNSTNISGVVTLGTGTINTNPLYVALANLRLTSNSPARFGAMGGGDMGALPFIADPTVGVVGTQWTNRTFTAAGSPYAIPGDYTVGAGVTVTLEPGVTFNFANADQMLAGTDTGRPELQVAGTLVADGTAALPITLTGGAAAGAWYGVDVFAAQPGTILDNVEIRFPVNGLTLRTPQPVTVTAVTINSARTRGLQVLSDNPTIGSIAVNTSGTNGSDAGIVVSGNASATVNNCVIRSQAGYGVYYIPSGNTHSLALVNCTIDRSTAYGVYTAGGGGTVTITSSIITNSGSFGVVRGDASTINVTYSDLWNNSTNISGVVTLGTGTINTNPLYVALANLRLTSNSPARFGAMGGGDMGALPFIADPTVGIVGTQWTNRTFTAAGSPYAIPGDYTVGAGVTVTLEPGVTFNFANADQMLAGTDTGRPELQVAGKLVADGTAALPITLTGGAAAGAWYGVDVFAAQPGTILDNVEIRFPVNGLTLRTPQPLTVTAVTINSARTRGLQILSDNPTIGSIAVNTSGTNGSDAGIVVSGNASATVNNCVIRSQAGYGVYYIPSGNTHALALINCTIDRSTAYGVYTAGGGGTVTITNSIITNSGSFGVVRGDASTINVTYSDLWNNSTNTSGVVTLGAGTISQNPNYVALNNLQLQGNSVCIDVGTATGAPAFDFRAVSRPLDGDGIGGVGFDMGAYEFVLAPVCGNGAVEPGEMCDSGAQNGMYGACNGTCTGFGPRCGDNMMNGPEQCDDGNAVNTDACLNTCVAATCGDTFIRAGVEACDDGNMVATDGCTSACQVAACGDGFVRAGVEACDDGNMANTDACLNTCALPTCGDGFIRAGVEMCDDANLVNTDACPNTCQNARCGDGFVRIGVEQCDDGNLVDNDGCRNNCTSASCGDGNVGAGEQCDDMNMSNTDACLNSCINASCGDGFTRAGVEMCDDGNASDTDACLPNCMNATCGDGHVRAGVEGCDDGNMVDTDACRNNCMAAACGDGVVRAGVEMCDDGNASNTDACVFACMTARCGDGFVQAGVETCDDANQVDTDACRNTCAAARCGDGVIQVGVEACDDGNQVNTDACTAACAVASCGDGIVHVGVEECDDGNTVQTDACINGCVAAQCGDGIVRAGVEACDDGNMINNDACTNQCVSSSCGDGVVQPGTETCDDANTVETDACRNNCMQATCGDGIIHAGVEACDDSNTTAGDGCSPTCQTEVEPPAPDDGGCCSTGNAGRSPFGGLLGALAILFVLRPRRRRLVVGLG